MKAHTLYRCYSAHGELLYIGLTTNLEQRMANHRSTSRWFARCAKVTTLDLGTDRDSALATESAAILLDQPTHNVKDKVRLAPKLTPQEIEQAGLVPPVVATRLAGIHGIPHPYWRRFLKPAARGVDGCEYFDPQYCERMRTAKRERLVFLPSGVQSWAYCMRAVVRHQVAAANREAADSVRGAA